MQKRQTRVTNIDALPMKASWWDTLLALRGLAKTITIISDTGLPLLTENNFQTPLPQPPFIWILPFIDI